MRDVLAALWRHAGERPGAIAFRGGNDQLTYAALARRVAGAAADMARQPPVIGLAGRNDLDWVVSDLAAAAAGKTLVPLPPFFSAEQIAHVVADAGIGAAIVTAPGTALPAGLPTAPPSLAESGAPPAFSAHAPRIIYTSGSTGRPKGVCLGDRQLDFSTRALAAAIDARPDDRYLSLLPFALLLESLCGIHVAVLAGGACHLAPEVLPAVLGGDLAALPRAVDAHRPTVSVIVPELLRAWTGALALTQGRATDSLRLVAIGGAPVPPDVLRLARALGLPAYEGYGLSECCAVVALNRPGDDAPGTVGRALPGLDVSIADDGEIVVRGPSAMDGYLGGAKVRHQTIHTGDLGRFDDDGRLVVLGRKDSVLVSAFGRNVSPEWIETMLTADFRIARAVLTGHGQAGFTVLLVPTAFGAAWLAGAGPDELADLIDLRCADAPAYARPAAVIRLADDELRAAGLLTGNNRPRRRAIQTTLAAWGDRAVALPRQGALSA